MHGASFFCEFMKTKRLYEESGILEKNIEIFSDFFADLCFDILADVFRRVKAV